VTVRKETKIWEKKIHKNGTSELPLSQAWRKINGTPKGRCRKERSFKTYPFLNRAGYLKVNAAGLLGKNKARVKGIGNLS